MKLIISALGSYVKKHTALLTAFTLTAVIFCVVFYLYSLPLEPVLYAVLLSALLLIILGVVRFRRFYENHKLLQGIIADIDVSLDALPEGGGLIEQDYKELIRALGKSKTDLIYAADCRYRDMLDYYTMWAHQIKTPIAAMRLMLQIEESEQNTELSDELFKIEQYVDMVMQFLRTESMSSDLLLKRCRLDAIVKAAVRKYRRQFLRRKVALDMGEIDCTVLTDEKWLSFVIEQVLSNALKYTHSGTVSIHMDDELPLTLVIEDTGIGIRPEDLPRVFERGFTGYNGREDKKSTGIGLYLCERILSRLSHTISIFSEVDRGTTVKIGLGTLETFIE